MPPPLNITWKTSGIKDLIRQTRDAADAFKKLAGATHGSATSNFASSLKSSSTRITIATGSLNLAAQALKTAAADMKAAASALGKGPAARAGAFDPNKTASWRMPKSNFASGPNQRLANYQNQLAMAQRMGNAAAIADLQNKVKIAQQQVNNLQPKTFGQKIANALMTSRVTMGANGMPQLMPLVNRLVSLVGPEAAAISAAVAAFAILTEKSAELARSFGNMAWTLGSSGSTTARIAGLAGALGMSPEALAGVANSIQGKITSDPMARSFAANSAGVYNISGPSGNQDYGKQLLKIMDALRGIKNQEERLIAARAIGAEALLGGTMLSDNQYIKIKQDASVTSTIFDPMFVQDSRDFMAALGRLVPALQNLFASVAEPFVGPATSAINALANILNEIAVAINGAYKIIGHLEHGNLKAAWNDLQDIRDQNDKMNDPEKQKSLNESMDRLSDSNDRLRDATMRAAGIYGQSERGRQAIPAGLNGEALRQALAAGGMNLPYF